MFSKNSAFEQERLQRLEREAHPLYKMANDKVELATPAPPFENWHHDLVTIDVLLDQHPPELHRARELLAEVADEIHSQYENVHGSRGSK